MIDKSGTAPARYDAPARWFHWLTASAVVFMIGLGFAMTYRGNTLDIWDDLTNALYSTHKLIGFLLIWLVAGRLVYRLAHGVPPDEPNLSRWHRVAARIVNWSLYGLLLIVPVLGWIGVSLYPSLTVFGVVDLPALARPDEEMATRVLDVHGWLAIGLALLASLHVAAALYHHLIRKDGVLRRMLPPR